MNRAISFAMLLACMACSQQKSADDLQRPADWQGEFEMIVALDSSQNEFRETYVLSSNCSQPISQLIDQLYDLAFSGDASVYGTTLFGEVDWDRPLNPKELVQELEFFDTVYVEDLITGELKDTVVDLSFKKSTVTSMAIQFAFDENGEINIQPYLIAIGKQVFSEETGERRGVSDKFFIATKEETDIDHSHSDRLVLYSDSLGQFNAHSFMIHESDSKQGLGEFIEKQFGHSSAYKVNFTVELRFSQSILVIKDFKVEPINPA